MHIHILGICGTFMGGVAALARAAGHEVTGSDANVYPPMSTQLKDLGVDIMEGYQPQHLDRVPDYVVVGNAMSRGNPVVETMLDRRISYCSGPQWLAEHVLYKRHVMAVSGTHGKTTTASILAWILDDAGLAPGFLIGGIPVNFEVSARSGESDYFVVEADEYDTAFFDKRAKFVHYRPQTLIINNLEFDHADIYADIDAIYWQFHQLMRTLPSNGRVIVNAHDKNIAKMLEQGCWTPVENFGLDDDSAWRASFADAGERRIRIAHSNGESAEVAWQLGGAYNLENALAAVAAAKSAGVPLKQAVDALSRFSGVKRRMERTATVSDVAIYDDFAHHPTAIRRAIEGLKKRFPGQRIVIALEPRSNTMKMGVHKEALPESLSEADLIFVYRPDELAADFDASLGGLGKRLQLFGDYDELLASLESKLLAGDQMVFMSNGSFGATRQKLTIALQKNRLTTD
ncbi:MAG: UDP-N-acetylmuramate:L-alanyl-gamma-D-glutamyl-meso-diaminopimelate ligase [Proteobacteria bacterium]|nr:UDP-N-acetylmuramate:L-alanyl-gamma-D-glutamyl-meso-diaminopimelate ligase [Pseudomonadota bacterium]TDJ36148.1 MAG: UDP-N-acetylmuramate:L-alanyl-gamma-D-glutamyl-meso-diaminopimelate ligase [Gammaproteobacteria bacterium]